MTKPKKLPTKTSKTHKLTERQQRFVDAYAVSGNATQAAKEAGYKGGAEVTGCRLLKLAKISLALAVIHRKRQRTATMDRNEREALLSKIARGLERGVRFEHRLKAVELLGKMGGDYASVAIVTPPGAAPGAVGIMQPEGDGGPIVTVYMPSNGR